MNSDYQEEYENESGEPEIDDLFPFLVVEEDLIDALAAKIRASLKSLDPDRLYKLAKFLFALERLPYVTPGISFDLAITQRIDEDLSYVSVELSEDAFRLSTGGSIYTPDIGSDSYSETNFEVESGGYREGTTEDFSQWLSVFRAMDGGISIDDMSEADIDLTQEVPDDGWGRLAAYWEWNGEGEFGY